MDPVKAKQLKALPVKLRVNGNLVGIHLLLGEHDELVGTSDPTLFRTWAEQQKPAARAVTVTKEDKRDIKFFTETPCWFNGCEELRAAYASELQQLEARPGGCRGCVKGSLMRKYLKLVADAQKS